MNPSEAFRFLVEERIVCEQSQKAKYTQRVDYIVQLPVPMDQATNTGESPRDLQSFVKPYMTNKSSEFLFRFWVALSCFPKPSQLVFLCLAVVISSLVFPM